MHLLINICMKFHKIVTVFLLLCCCQYMIAQEEPKGPDINNTYITFDTFSAFGFLYPRYTFGYVTPIHRRWMVGLDAGYGNDHIIAPYFNNSDLIGDRYRIFELKPRIYFKLRPSGKSQSYVSLEFFYINHKDHFVNSTDQLREKRYVNLNYNQTMATGFGILSYDSADYIRFKTGFNVNAGFFLNLSDKIGVNMDLGLGYRNRYTTYKNLENPRRFVPQENENFTTYPLTVDLGNAGGANITLNIKLFYKFENVSFLYKSKIERLSYIN